MTKTEILTVLNARLARSETLVTIAEEIKAGLKFVSEIELWPCLHHSTTSALIAGTNYIAHPTDYRKLDFIVLNDGSYDGSPLEMIEGGFEQWLINRDGSDSQSEPDSYVERGGKFYLDPTSNGAFTATIYFWRYHPDQETILFTENFRETVFNAVMGKYLESKKQLQAASYYLQMATVEAAKLPHDRKPVKMKYRDI